MRGQRLYFAEARTAAALVCAALAVLIVISEAHFTVHARQPSTFLLAEHHKCGRVLLLCLGWLAVESAHLVFRLLFPVEAPHRVRHIPVVY